MDDSQMIALSKRVLAHHFGVRNSLQESVCATCGSLDVPWPCDPATLAQETQTQVLAR
ncbi:MAG TPA: hypothetical protein VLS51_06670 [Propionibacteriaceae bacterium]|nr:hypothetical protein [Propionibacteriaceae bacterium]